MKVAKDIKKRIYDKEYHNRPEVKARQKQYRKDRKEQIRAYKKEYNKKYGRKRRYNLNEQEFIEMLSRQNNRCAICSVSLECKKVCLDHNHETKRIRGLLCHNCNVALGLFKDNLLIIESAIKYMRGVN
jgi:hypothetical protein